MLSPYSLQGSQTPWCLNVTNNTNCHHWWGLYDSTAFNNLFLVDFRARSVDFSDDVSHASLVAHEAGQVDRFGRVILGEGLWFTLMALGAFLGQESLGSMARGLKLPVRLKYQI